MESLPEEIRKGCTKIYTTNIFYKQLSLLTLHNWRVVLEEELVEILVNEGTETSVSQGCDRSHDHHMITNIITGTNLHC